MNPLSDGEQVIAFLRHIDWISDHESASVERFPGGVSGFVWKIKSPRGTWVLKQPLEKLATEEEWISDTRRLDVEVAALRQVYDWFPARVPEVLHHDPTQHICLMSCAPDDAVNWKQQMMDGQFDVATAAAAGLLLRDIHRQSLNCQETTRPAFEDLTFFHQLRIEPFHRFLIDRHEDLEGPIEGIISDLVDRRTMLVHGDFSPKNLLVRPNGELILLDFEVAHWGNPVFDVAYCTAHLMLKAWAIGPAAAALACIEAFLSHDHSIDRLLPHLGLMLLARLDGKSTVDYVTDATLREKIRHVASGWIRDGEPGDPMIAIAEALA